ncbi:hypothetical protein HPP92_015083 [Vanilla planifolia]|uniref:tRNA-binding domain-containing protein n=1 Tax=Vanilla planifolia TaxID=51239 RepID=A0A835QV69_VANPL|nr:hypothetical protein HPP92_015083 [Vanilla planifolia]
MAAIVETTTSKEIISRRNEAVIYALCNHLSLDPKNFLTESAESAEIKNLVSVMYHSSKDDAYFSRNQDEVMKWATFADNFPVEKTACNAVLKDLNEDLSKKAVLLGGLKPSVADAILFSAVHAYMSHLSDKEVQKYSNVIRWLDYIQNKEDFGGAFDTITVNKPEFEHFHSVDMINADLVNKKATETIKAVEKLDGNLSTKKGVQEAPANDKSSVGSIKGNKVADVKAATESTKKSTEKKEPSAEMETLDKNSECAVNILNIQVGLICKAWKHPSADSLLVEEIDVGDGNQRQVVSGLAKYFSPDKLTNRLVVLVTNVKPGKLRDVMSSGLVLCASNQDHTIVEPLTPPEGVKIGERISFSGFEGSQTMF